MRTISLEEFVADLGSDDAATVRELAKQIDSADAAVTAAFREREARFFPAVLGGALFVAVVGNEILGDRAGFLRELRELVGSLGIMAAVLAGVAFPVRWLRANWRYGNTITASHAINVAHFQPLGAWYGHGSVVVRPPTPGERKAKAEEGRELLARFRAAKAARVQSMNGKGDHA